MTTKYAVTAKPFKHLMSELSVLSDDSLTFFTMNLYLSKPDYYDGINVWGCFYIYTKGPNILVSYTYLLSYPLPLYFFSVHLII